jgi:exonuclease III
MLTIISWNVENFKKQKVDDVTNYLKTEKPDIFAIYEVTDAEVYKMMADNFSEYSSFLTVGQEKQHILVACSNKFEAVKYQQKDEFRSGNPNLRPGVFLTLKYSNQYYGLLFLHTDSGTTAVDFGNRSEMFLHAAN